MRARHIKLFKDGQSQFVHIPRAFELPGEDVIIRKEGDRLIIEPSKQVIEDLPPDPVKP